MIFQWQLVSISAQGCIFHISDSYVGTECRNPIMSVHHYYNYSVNQWFSTGVLNSGPNIKNNNNKKIKLNRRLSSRDSTGCLPLFSQMYLTRTKQNVGLDNFLSLLQ